MVELEAFCVGTCFEVQLGHFPFVLIVIFALIPLPSAASYSSAHLSYLIQFTMKHFWPSCSSPAFYYEQDCSSASNKPYHTWIPHCKHRSKKLQSVSSFYCYQSSQCTCQCSSPLLFQSTCFYACLYRWWPDSDSLTPRSRTEPLLPACTFSFQNCQPKYEYCGSLCVSYCGTLKAFWINLF